MIEITVRDTTVRRRWTRVLGFLISSIVLGASYGLFGLTLHWALGGGPHPRGPQTFGAFLVGVFPFSAGLGTALLMALVLVALIDDYARRRPTYASYGMRAAFGGTNDERRLLFVDLGREAVINAVDASFASRGTGSLSSPHGIRTVRGLFPGRRRIGPQPLVTTLRVVPSPTGTCIEISSGQRSPWGLNIYPFRIDYGEALRSVEETVADVRRCLGAAEAPQHAERAVSPRG